MKLRTETHVFNQKYIYKIHPYKAYIGNKKEGEKIYVYGNMIYNVLVLLSKK